MTRRMIGVLSSFTRRCAVRLNRRVRLICGLWLSALVPFIMASRWPGLFSDWYPAWSQTACAGLSYVTGVVPFSLGELGIAALGVSAVVHWVRAILRGKKHRHVRREAARALGVTLIWGGALAASFVWLWGINYFMPTFSRRIGLERKPSSLETLTAAASFAVDRANRLADSIPRDQQLRMTHPTFWEARQSVSRAYAALAEEYDFITPHAVPVKRITFWPLQSYTGISGVYIPWTAESNVNPDTPWPNIVPTMAHELAHRQGAAPEDEANFLALLACRASDDPYVNYSGAYMEMIYITNSLATAAPFMYLILMQDIDAGVNADMDNTVEHYQQYEGPVNDAGEAVNDTYLKVVGQQEQGVESYGMVTDLLIADMLARGWIT